MRFVTLTYQFYFYYYTSISSIISTSHALASVEEYLLSFRLCRVYSNGCSSSRYLLLENTPCFSPLLSLFAIKPDWREFKSRDLSYTNDVHPILTNCDHQYRKLARKPLLYKFDLYKWDNSRSSLIHSDFIGVASPQHL